MKVLISYAVTVSDEIEEIKRLLPFLLEHKRAEDRLVVLFDNVKGTQEVKDYLLHYVTLENKIPFYAGEFEGHFADWKNKLTSYCSGTHIFQIDADELPDLHLIRVLPKLLELNKNVDVFLVPRENTVEGLTEEHVRKWGWNVDKDGRVNWPDFQWRIYRNREEVKWVNTVHERLEGYDKYSYLPPEPRFSLLHAKDIARQERQNEYYETL